VKKLKVNPEWTAELGNGEMSHPRYGDTDLVYWMGRSINAMTREELQIALGEADDAD